MAKADHSVAVFGAGVLLKHLGALVEEIAGVRFGDDVEHLHRMRVASRRLRAALPLFARSVAPKQSKKWAIEVRRITRALGAARDADVQIEQLNGFLASLPVGTQRAGIRRLVLRRTQYRAKLQPMVNTALDRFESSGVIETVHEACTAALADGPPEFFSSRLYHLAHRSISEKISQFLAYEPFVDQPERIEELHAMRIAAKQLRYTVEVFAPLYQNDGSLKPYLAAIKEAQELLGQIHDCDVWIEQLPRFIEKERSRSQRYFGHERPFKRLIPGLQAFQHDRRQYRDQAYGRFLQCWQAWRTEELWGQLMETVRRPDLPEQANRSEPGEVAA